MTTQQGIINNTANAIINILRHAEIKAHWESIIDEVKAGMNELEAEVVYSAPEYDRHPDGNMGC